MMNQIKTSKKNILSSLETVNKIVINLNKFDSLIQKASISYDFERISKVELTILRLAIHELLNEKIPFQIVISEAIRLTKKFSSKHSISFINAILDIIYKENENNSK